MSKHRLEIPEQCIDISTELRVLCAALGIDDYEAISEVQVKPTAVDVHVFRRNAAGRKFLVDSEGEEIMPGRYRKVDEPPGSPAIDHFHIPVTT